MYIAAYDTNGAILYATQTPDGLATPDGFVQITDAQFAEIDAYQITNGAVVPLDPAVLLKKRQAGYAADIDGRVAAIYSNWSRFQAEYDARLTAAQTYKNAGYTGDVSPWISAYASAASISSQAAADNILSQGNSLNAALQTLGGLRMQKYAIQNASDLAAATTIYTNLLSQIEQVAASIN